MMMESLAGNHWQLCSNWLARGCQ